MDTEAEQNKAGSNVQFLPVILLKGAGGWYGMEARGEAGCCATESTFYCRLHPEGEAIPAPPRLSRQSGTRATGGNLWKDHSPQPHAWKVEVCIPCE